MEEGCEAGADSKARGTRSRRAAGQVGGSLRANIQAQPTEVSALPAGGRADRWRLEEEQEWGRRGSGGVGA